MKKLSCHLDDALFILALAVPFMFSVARYVETAVEASAILLAHQARKEGRCEGITAGHDRDHADRRAGHDHHELSAPPSRLSMATIDIGSLRYKCLMDGADYPTRN